LITLIVDARPPVLRANKIDRRKTSFFEFCPIAAV
jgi:hypothetical protein